MVVIVVSAVVPITVTDEIVSVAVEALFSTSLSPPPGYQVSAAPMTFIFARPGSVPPV